MLIKYGGTSLVPDKLALSTGWLDHALFAIKHEGVRLHYLTAALRLVSAEEMEAEFLRTPNGTFVRKLCLLWEADHQRSLPAVDPQPVAAAYLPMFDPAANVTGASRRNARWLVDVAFCPVVRKTDAVLQGLQHDVLADAKAFATSIGPQMLERALSWAYLSDTEGSFAI